MIHYILLLLLQNCAIQEIVNLLFVLSDTPV